MGLLDKFVQKNNISARSTQQLRPMLGLSISAGVVKATIWELKDHTIEIIGLGVKNFSESGNETHPEYKIIAEKAADAIDIACQVAEVDVRECVFGVPQSWIVEEELLPEYDELTSTLAKNLDIEAIAYVSIPHALSYYLQYLHKTPPTAILIGTSREGAQIAYVENGKIKEHTNITWVGGNLGKNIDNGLMQLQSLNELPPTMFLYGFGDMNSARDELMKYNWASAERLGHEKKAPTMVTIPKIVVLEEHADALAIALVGAKDFARHNNIHGRLSIKSLEYAALNTQTPAVQENNEHQLVEAAPVLPDQAAPADLLQTEPEELEAENPKPEMGAHTDTVPFGFVVDKDIAHNEESIREDTELEELETEAEKEEDIVEEKVVPTEFEQEEQSSKPWHAHEDHKPQQQSRLQPARKFRMSAKNTRQILYIGVIVTVLMVVVGGTSVWAYWNVPKATVTVYVKPDNLEKQITVTASEKTTEVGNSMIPAKKIALELIETRDASTSGKRTTGQVAKGEVTIINKTGAAKTFAAGTEMRTGSNIKFTISESVTIASASAQTTDSGETKTYGKANVKATATDIGPEGNIEKDTSLALAGFTKDDYEAKAYAAFSGGSKKDIKVVSANDRTNLSRDLRSDMQFKIPEQLRAKVNTGEILLDKAWQMDSVADKFNKAVNDEADTVSLQTTMKISAYVFMQSDVEKLLEGVSMTSVPDGYELKDQTKDIRTDFVNLSKEGVITLNAISKVNIIPKIDSESIAKQIVGKQEEAAKQTILDNNKVYDVSFEYSVKLPAPLMTLPHRVENITVTRGVR